MGRVRVRSKAPVRAQALGDALKKWRKARGLTQAEASVLVGTTQRSWCVWENGLQIPTAAKLAKIAAASGGALSLSKLVAACASPGASGKAA